MPEEYEPEELKLDLDWPANESGKWWVYELTYGVEKAIQLKALTRQLKGKSLSYIVDCGDEINKRVSKLNRVQGQLSRLIGTHIVLEPLDTEQTVTPIEGILKSYSLEDGTLIFFRGKEEITTRFCDIIDNQSTGLQVIPLISMRTDQEHKF